MRAVIGIDAGTTAIKSVAFSLDGTVLAVARRTVGVNRGASSSSASESDMDEVWGLAVETLREVIDAVPDREIVAIGVTGQGDGAWFVDASGAPAGPAVLWNDGRSTEVVREWEGTGANEAVRAATGSPIHPGALPAIWEALRRDGAQPAAAHHLNCKDWIRYRLVGAMATDPTEASRTYLDTATGEYSTDLAAALGHEELLAMLPEPLPSERIAGTLLPDVQRLLGLDAAVPVAVGVFDTVAAGVGLGAIADGDSYVVLGTTAVVCTNQPSARERHHPDSILLRTGRGEQVTECLAQMSGMPNLDWARATLGLDAHDWTEIEERLAGPDDGAGALFLPYTSPSGERAPFRDLHASAGWVGAHVTTSKWALLRAVYAGLAHSVYESVLGLDGGAAGEPGDAASGDASITIGGGGAQSPLLCRMLADLSGRTVIRQVDGEVGARGAAAVALAAAGGAPDLAAAVAALKPETESFTPEPTRRAAATAAFEAFRDVRDALRPLWPSLHRLGRPSHAEHPPIPEIPQRRTPA
ncbi:hypothetical protein JD276_05085 [Leucobacter sp. CSA1]|uniref:Carbohydrate kinase n=1 Tax=Leucobacter chromiisoli TaxID=2796471 RepID=A0A934Q7S2_9MICO|nr:FGGY family carbohydrate kinase [Leucobacter chromiisoli]MBK0418407.1 hypothetical protein [Leucobacter chromiisoli]